MRGVTTGPRGVSAGAEVLAALVPERPPRAGTNRVVVVDGFSGSGKTTLAGRLAAALGAPLVHGEDVVPGWEGFAEGVRHVSEALLEPVARGQPGRLRRWDWQSGRPGAEVLVAPAPVLVVEGCGLLAMPARHLVSTGVWLDVPAAERARRLDGRDDRELYLPHRARWAEQEEALARLGGPAAADMVLSAG